jgi:hypothetical protein
MISPDSERRSKGNGSAGWTVAADSDSSLSNLFNLSELIYKENLKELKPLLLIAFKL